MANEVTESTAGMYGVPVVALDRRTTLFEISELYTGVTGTGNQVPNVNDLIVDYDNNAFWRVTEVDYTNYAYVYTPFTPATTFNDDIAIGGCAPSASDTFRVYINDNKHPATLRVDGRLTVAGTDLDSVKIFRGKTIDSTGEVISGNYSNGSIVSDRIPLNLVNTSDNVAIKSVAAGVCTKDVADGELVTIVFYSNESEVTAIAYCYVVKTNMVMAMEAPVKQILDVKLISPFMSKSDLTLLELPINIPLDDIPLQAEIQYTDGSSLITIDGSSASLNGLRNSGSHDTFYISSVVGQELPLTLSYRLSSNETYVGDDLVDGVINKPYKASTLEIDGAYSVKLFVVPRWVSVDVGYRLNYYLYDLERGNVFDATSYVTAGENSEVFDPKLYNYKQRMIVRVDLSDVSQTYNAHIHPQSFHLSLLTPGNETADNYILDYLHDGLAYGEGVIALYEYTNVTYSTLDLSFGASSQAEWLGLVYEPIYPLYDRRSESSAPTPTHFVVEVGSYTYVRPIETWMTPFTIDTQPSDGDFILIKFIQRTPQDTLQLGLASTLAHQK